MLNNRQINAKTIVEEMFWGLFCLGEGLFMGAFGLAFGVHWITGIFVIPSFDYPRNNVDLFYFVIFVFISIVATYEWLDSWNDIYKQSRSHQLPPRPPTFH